MPFQRVPNVVGVEVRGTLLGQAVENTLYYSYEGSLTPTMLSTLTGNIAAVVESDWLELLPAGWEGREVYARDLNVEVALQSTNTDISGLDGTAAGETYPSFNTIAIARRSGRTGRAARGRIFWMGLSETMVVLNNVAEVWADGMAAALTTADEAAVTAGFEPAIVSREGSAATPTLAVVYPLATWLAVDYEVDTRRSRKIGSGS